MNGFRLFWVVGLLLSSGGPLSAGEPAVSPGFLAELLFMEQELANNQPGYLSPTDILASRDGKLLYVAQQSAKRVDYIDAATGKVLKSVSLPKAPTGLALNKDGTLMYVTCYSDQRPAGLIVEINASDGAIFRTLPAGHSPRSPVLSPDDALLYLCNQFEDAVSAYSISSGRKIKSYPVIREPYAAAITPDGNYLAVANLLPTGRSDLAVIDPTITISASVSIIQTATGQVSNVALADGAHSLLDVCISSDGKYAYVSHVLARYPIPPTKIEAGWISSNGFSVIDILGKKAVNVILLDDLNQGAANPWGMTVADNLVFITAAGSHELITVNEKEMLTRLKGQPDLSYKFTFARPFKQRIRLNVKGPRVLHAAGGKAYLPGYFSGDIDVVTFTEGVGERTATFNMGQPAEIPLFRKGESLFYDAAICQQNWMSCHSCHPFTRTDGLNWDLLNDGTGNPKNDKSMLFAHFTPPAMASGVRDSAEIAVRAGIKFILFATPNEADAVAIDKYLAELRPVPSPYLVNGILNESALRGKALFYGKFQCNVCHPPPLYTDMKFHDLGTKGALDMRSSFDTPTLVENWRTAPYLHDGRYATLKELFQDGKHGIFVPVTPQELDDLIEFNNSL